MISIKIEIPKEMQDQLERKLKNLLDPFVSEDIEKAQVEALKPLRDEVKGNIDSITDPLTGRLAKAVKLRRGKRRHRLFSSAYVAMDRKIAPHAHLVEYGHEIVGHKPNKVRTGKFTQPRPYFRWAVADKAAEVQALLIEKCKQLIEGAARR